MARLIGQIYGDALFDLAREQDQVDVLYEEAEFVAGVFRKEPELQRLLCHPRIVREEKIAVIERIFRDRVSRNMTGFLTTVIQKDRQGELESMLMWFIRRVKEERRIGSVEVTVPMPLTDEQKKAVETRILATTPYRSLEVNYVLDPSLLGGMKIRIGDRVVDSSVRRRLEDMKRQLIQNQLK